MSLLGLNNVASTAVHWTGQIELSPGANQVCDNVDDGTQLSINGTVLFNDYFITSGPHVSCGTAQ